MKESYLNLISQQKYIFLYSSKNQTHFFMLVKQKMWAVSQPQSETVKE